MSTGRERRFFSEEDSLAGEQVAEFKSEYIDGQVCAMSGDSVFTQTPVMNKARD